MREGAAGALQDRHLGTTGVALSPLAVGTMRMNEQGASAMEWVRLLTRMVDLGVNTFHVSPEYESYPFFLRCLRALRRDRPGARLRFVVKVPEPHFEDRPAFDAARLEARIDRARLDLGAERVDVVQWLLRSKPIDDAPRLRVLRDGRGALEHLTGRLLGSGRVGALLSFPYGRAFACAVRYEPCVGGLVDYLGLAELHAAADLDALRDLGRGFVALRPLFAGRLVRGAADEGLRACLRARLGLAEGASLVPAALRFALLHPAVASVVVSVSSQAHLSAAVAVARATAPDAGAFHATWRAVRRPLGERSWA